MKTVLIVTTIRLQMKNPYIIPALIIGAAIVIATLVATSMVIKSNEDMAEKERRRPRVLSN